MRIDKSGKENNFIEINLYSKCVQKYVFYMYK